MSLFKLRNRAELSAATCLEAVFAEDLVEEVQDLELHAGYFVVLLCALHLGLVHHLVHTAALPQVVFRWLGSGQGEQGAQYEELHCFCGCKVDLAIP